MLDRAEFPRDKPCGGGVNIRAAKLLPFEVAPVTERVIYGMRISVAQKREYTRYADEPLTYLTQRRKLDAYLADRAVAQGADFRERLAVRDVERSDTHIVVRAGRERFETRMVIAADGANGPTAKLAGLTTQRSKEIALEGNITPSDAFPIRWRDLYGIDVGSVPGGYGWLFPKGDHVNIGVGGVAPVGPTLRDRLAELTRFYGFNPDEFWGLRGHPLPVRLPGSPCARGNVAAIGDAAGLLDPLSGEGIYAALWSGTRIAEHCARVADGVAPDLEPFTADVDREIGRDLRTSRELHALFHLGPAAWAVLVERSDRAWRLLCGLLTGDATYAAIKDRSTVLEAGIEWSARLAQRRTLVPET
jgi:geranylgeranyl reductase family protein